MSIRELAATILAAVTDGGGITINVNGDRPTNGFAVSVAAAGLVTGTVPTAGLVEEWIDSIGTMLCGDDMYLGAWLDTETGKVHLDVTQVLDTEDQAHRQAVLDRQLAYFDLKKGREVRLEVSGA